MPIDYQNALLNLMRQAEARRKQTEYEAPLVPSTALQVGNLLARVGGDIMARRDRQAAESKLNLANQTNEAARTRQTSFENAMNMYRSGVQVPAELAKQAGVEGLARVAPKEKSAATYAAPRVDAEGFYFNPKTGARLTDPNTNQPIKQYRVDKTTSEALRREGLDRNDARTQASYIWGLVQERDAQRNPTGKINRELLAHAKKINAQNPYITNYLKQMEVGAYMPPVEAEETPEERAARILAAADNPG